MSHYSAERKASVLRKLLSPHKRSVPEVAREEGICDQTLYNWRKQAKQQGAANGMKPPVRNISYEKIEIFGSTEEMQLNYYCI